MTKNRLLNALKQEQPLQIVGAINAYTALLAQDVGFHAIYLSGSGVAGASFGLPDLAMTTLTEIVSETRRITAATKLPLLVDVDTGFGDGLNIRRMIKEMVNSGAPDNKGVLKKIEKLGDLDMKTSSAPTTHRERLIPNDYPKHMYMWPG